MQSKIDKYFKGATPTQHIQSLINIGISPMRLFQFLLKENCRALYDPNVQAIFQDVMEKLNVKILSKERYFRVSRAAGLSPTACEKLWRVFPVVLFECNETDDMLIQSAKRLLERKKDKDFT
jgi:hypothetical protein